MPHLEQLSVPDPSYALRDLVEKRRDVLRAARSLPVGPERNQLRQIALSLRALCSDGKWLLAHTLEGSLISLR
jgi:hypothetical protein